jgi:hypothetical protein
MPSARNEQIRAAAAEIKRHATVAGIKRRALDPAPIPDGSYEQKFGGKFAIVTPNRRAPRAIRPSRRNMPGCS